jgi:hypothetical protein
MTAGELCAAPIEEESWSTLSDDCQAQSYKLAVRDGWVKRKLAWALMTATTIENASADVGKHLVPFQVRMHNIS